MPASEGQTVMPLTRHSLLVRIIQDGDAASWDEFFSIYHPYLQNVMHRWGVPQQDACEIVQDVFVTLVHALPRFEYRPRRGRFRGWLKTVARNALLDFFRRRARAREVSLWFEPGTPSITRSDAEWDQSDRLHTLRRAMQHIRARSNELTWRCFEEHLLKQRTAADVGRELQITRGAVYVNASRTLARVRRECAACGAETADAAGRALGDDCSERGASSRRT